MPETVKIYVQLLEEGTDTARGTEAVELGGGFYKVLPTPHYDPEDEKCGVEIMTDTVKIYIELLEEGTPTIRGTDAISLGNGVYKVLATPNYDPEDEIWKFLPGSLVRCEPRKNFGEEILYAVEKVG